MQTTLPVQAPAGLYQKKFQILQEISTALVASDNISAIANLIVDLAISYTSAERGSLMLLNDRSELYVLASRGIDLKQVRMSRVKFGEGISGVIAQKQIPCLIEDINKEADFTHSVQARYKTNSFISCPIVCRNRLLGVLNINDKKDLAAFNEDEFELIQVVANQAAIALENAILMSQLKNKATELEDINQELITRDTAKTEFLTSVSHELRTPLNSIKGSLYYLLHSDSLPIDEQREFLDIVAGETTTLISSVENLLNFLRLNDETTKLNNTVVNLNTFLAELAESKHIKHLLSCHGLNLSLSTGILHSDIVGDRIRIIQFFECLIEGMSDFLEQSDTIAVNMIEELITRIEIKVPRAMPDDIKSCLLNSTNSFHRERQGNTIKLYLARKIADTNSWYLDVQSSANQSTVTITIPQNDLQKQSALVDATTELFVDLVTDLMQIETCSLMLVDEESRDLTIKSARGLHDDIVRKTRVKSGEMIAGWVAREGEPLYLQDIEKNEWFRKKNETWYGSGSCISLPLKINTRVFGVLNLSNKKSGEPFALHDFYIASELCERIAAFIDNIKTRDSSTVSLQQITASIDTLLNAVRKYDKKEESSGLVLLVLEHLGASEEEKKLALYSSLVYDLGLALIDESIHDKGALTPAEARMVRFHPYTTVGLLNGFEYSDDVRSIIVHHHEHYDGTGYPDQLRDDKIPFASRILAVVDAYTAMTSDRPYRTALSAEEALKQLKMDAGTVFDPTMVHALESVMVGSGGCGKPVGRVFSC